MERHIVIALSLAVIVIPSVVLSAPALLDKLMDVDVADEAHYLERREVDDAMDDTWEVRERRASQRTQCIHVCLICNKFLQRESLKLGDCIVGCTHTTKMLTNPLVAQSWSRCNSNYAHS